MSESNRVRSATEIARRRKAQKAKRNTLTFLGLTVLVLASAVVVWGYRNGWFTHADRSKPSSVSETDSQQAGPVQPQTSAEPPRAYPIRNVAFICNPSRATRPRMAKFLKDSLASFGPKQAVDVMVLTADGDFTSETNGCVEMTPTARTTACDLIAASADATQVSVKSALNRASDEHAAAVYLLTTANAAAEFGPDPATGLKLMTGDRASPINCVVFLTPTDSADDLKSFKSLAKSTHGEYIPILK